MGTLQENQSLNAEYERNKKEREMKEEIERLTELCNKYEEEHKTTFETWQKDIKENKLLHSIIKEAIEYINEMTLTSDGYANYGDDLRPEHIVDILKGEQ